MKKQLIIIGGGAAGLAAAVTASSYGMRDIAILERQSRTGKKILATGNGRCNLSHNPLSAEDYYGSCQVQEILDGFGTAEDFFASLGLHCRTDAQGRIYPYSLSAAAVLDALRLACAQNGVEEICDANVTALVPQKHAWLVRTEKCDYIADAVIFAAGGYAAPQLGTDGSAWRMLEKLGIPITEPRPVLCPILSDAAMLRPLKGLRVKAEAVLLEKAKALYRENGEVQFTQQALSGICIFNMAGYLNLKRLEHYQISLNLLPDQKPSETLGMLYAFQAVRCDADCETMLTGIVQKPLARLLLKLCGVRADMPCSSLNGAQMQQLTDLLHDLRFPAAGVGSWSQAQATAGGVSAEALDAHLQVKQHPHLYVVGEAVDVHSICGGYHLHWAWSSGAHAAKHIVERREQR